MHNYQKIEICCFRDKFVVVESSIPVERLEPNLKKKIKIFVITICISTIFDYLSFMP